MREDGSMTDLNKEREKYLQWHFDNWKLNCAYSDSIEEAQKIYERIYQNNKPSNIAERERGYMAWIAAKAQAVPETHILVEKSKIETWWQDAEEPENFASSIEDVPSLGHYLAGDEIMEITEHHTIHLPSKTIYGVWVDKDGDRSFCTGTMEECIALTSSESGAEG